MYTLKETAKLVKVTHSDLGIAHDGDGDRTVLIDDKGRIVQDQVFSSLAVLVLLDKIRKGLVIISVNTSRSVEKFVSGRGCKVKQAKLGKTFLEMKRVNGILATEPSKVTDASWGIWEDGVYAVAKIVQYISNSKDNLSGICGRIPSNFYYQKNILLERIDQNVLKQRILRRYGKEKIESLDGWKIIFNDGSFSLFRISGTEPKVRIYVDSRSKNKATKLLEEGIKIVKSTHK
jgi:phosphomannomutase